MEKIILLCCLLFTAPEWKQWSWFTKQSKPQDAFQFYEETTFSSPSPRKIKLLLPEWCPACKTYQFDGEDTFEVEIVRSEMFGCRQYPAIYEPDTSMFYYGTSILSRDTLVKAIQFYEEKKGIAKTAGITLGAVDKKYVDEIRNRLLKINTINLENEPFPIIEGKLSADVPANFLAKRVEDRWNFKTRVPVEFSHFFTRKVSGITLSESVITFHIDLFPDISFNIRETNGS